MQKKDGGKLSLPFCPLGLQKSHYSLSAASPRSEPKVNDGCFYIKVLSNAKEAVPLFCSNKNG